MDLKIINNNIAVSPQISTADLAIVKEQGYTLVVCHRPDGEGADQVNFDEIEDAAKKLDLKTIYQPVVSGKITDSDVAQFKAILAEAKGPVFAYCRTGTRSTTLWSLAVSDEMSVSDILTTAKTAGYDMSGVVRRIVNGGTTPIDATDKKFDIVVVGAGAAGIAVSASLLERKPELTIAIIDPADIHYYQPGWTLVGAGVFTPRV